MFQCSLDLLFHLELVWNETEEKKHILHKLMVATKLGKANINNTLKQMKMFEIIFLSLPNLIQCSAFGWEGDKMTSLKPI